MSAIAIVGAGPLGGEIACLLARRDDVGHISLIDEHGQVAVGKALDIRQSAPIQGFATSVAGSSDFAAAAGMDIIVIADRAGRAESDEWRGDDGLGLMRRLVEIGGRTASPGTGSPTVVVCAGATHERLVEYGVRDLGLPRHRIFGSAPEALSAGARALVALEVGCSPRDVGMTVIGRPPHQPVILWEEASVAGFSAVRRLDETTRRRITALIERMWPPGPLTLAAAAAKAVHAVLGQSHQRMTAFVAPDDANGRRTRTVALPVKLGPRGIESVEHPTLSARDRVALDTTMLL